MALHAPEIIFLLGLMLGRRGRWKARGAEVGRQPRRECTPRFISGGCRNRMFGFDAGGWNAMVLAVGLADQCQQLVIMHVLDLICEYNEATINLVEFSPLETISQLFTTQTQCVSSRMLPQYQLGIRHPNGAGRHDFVG